MPFLWVIVFSVWDGTDSLGNSWNSGNYSKIESKGLGEDSPLYTNEIPEGRFYNRTVRIIIQTPLEYFEENEKE